MRIKSTTFDFKMVTDLAHCGELLRSLSPIHSQDEQPDIIAENELLGAASSIEAVSNRLAQICPRQVHVSLFA